MRKSGFLTAPPMKCFNKYMAVSSRFFDLLNSMTYDLKRSVDQRWLFDLVLHSSLDDLVFVTKLRLVQGGVVRREVLSKLQNTELMKLIDVDHKSLSFDIWPKCSAICLKKKTSTFMSFPITMNEMKYCQRHNGPQGWVHITSSHTNLDQSSSSESRTSINIKYQPNINISIKLQLQNLD